MNTLWGRSQKTKLLLADLSLLGMTLALMFLWRTDMQTLSLLQAPGFYFVLSVQLVALYVFGAFDFEADSGRAAVLVKLLCAVVVAIVLVIAINFMLGKERAGVFGRGVFIGGLGAYFVLASVLRLFILQIQRKQRSQSRWLLIADSVAQQRLNLDIKNLSEQFVLDVPGNAMTRLQSDWSGVVIATSQAIEDEVSHKLLDARFRGQSVIGVLPFYERFLKKMPVYALTDHWLLNSDGFRIFQSPASLRMKRIMDWVLAVIIAVLTLPLMLLAWLAIRLESAGPAIYKQTRTGRQGEPFTIYKFRSMRTDAEKDGAKWADVGDSRITRVGQFIRKTRIDELPQLWNVLKGEMSFIGPRPERPEFNRDLEKQIAFYNLRHSVRPGLTGWAQVMYPYGASVEDSRQKLQYDLFYIKNHTLLLDVLILLRTVRVVLFGHGR